MVALFRRGELKVALLEALSRVEPANGYVIMQTIADVLDGAWQPSPGAVYPALLGLEDAGLVEGRTWVGTRVYRLTPRGQRAVTDYMGTLAAVASRAKPRGTPLGRILDEWVGGFPGRDRRLDDEQKDRLFGALLRVQHSIEQTTSEVIGHG